MSAIVLATANTHKVEELTHLLAPCAHRLLGLNELSFGDQLIEPEESGDRFQDNAAIKALSYAQQTGYPCIADDSGLEVKALRGAPGVHSARYASEVFTDGMTRADRDRCNNEKLLRAMQDLAPGERHARFVCCMCLAVPERNEPRPGEHKVSVDEARSLASSGATLLGTATGAMEGVIGCPPDVPRGEHGFGYDPLFLVSEIGIELPAGTPPGLTNAELAPELKNRISHRAAAAGFMLEQLLAFGTDA